jgi:hypothetical protein
MKLNTIEGTARIHEHQVSSVFHLVEKFTDLHGGPASGTNHRAQRVAKPSMIY